jgi:hypothetical protein
MMSQKTHCDRCDGVIHEGATKYQVKIRDEDYELCPDCIDLLDVFMEGEKS